MTAPFDITLTDIDEKGNHVRFLLHPLDETYIKVPVHPAPEGMLPPQEIEVFEILIEVQKARKHQASFNVLHHYFNTKQYRIACRTTQNKQRQLLAVVNTSREHKAALRRLVSATPITSGAREVLAAYLV